MDGNKTETGVQSINRAFQILETLAEVRRGLSIAELTDLLKLNKTTVHRILQALISRGYVSKDERTKLYRLGMKVVGLSSHYLNGLELKTEALPFLEYLQHRTETFVHLGILEENEVVYLEKIGPYAYLRMYSQIGKRAPIHATALGKAIFANLTPEKQESILAEIQYEACTEKTVTEEAAFLREVAQAKKRGYAVDDEENELGMRCVAAPIFDYTGRVLAAVSVSGYTAVMTKEKMEQYAAYALECAAEISAHMGYRTET